MSQKLEKVWAQEIASAVSWSNRRFVLSKKSWSSWRWIKNPSLNSGILKKKKKAWKGSVLISHFFFHATICPRLECNVLYVHCGMHLLTGLLICSTSCTMSKSLFSQHSFNNGTTGRACNHTVRNTQKNSNYPVSSDRLPILNLIPVPPQVSSATFIWQQSRIPLPNRIVEVRLATVPSRFSVSRMMASHWWRDQALVELRTLWFEAPPGKKQNKKVFK